MNPYRTTAEHLPEPAAIERQLPHAIIIDCGTPICMNAETVDLLDRTILARAALYDREPETRAECLYNLVREEAETMTMKQLTCGCCSSGCTCLGHADVSNGRAVRTCSTHAAMPFAPLDRSFRWDDSAQQYVRVPVEPSANRG